MSGRGLRALASALVVSGLGVLSHVVISLPAVAQDASSAPAAPTSAGVEIDRLRERAAAFWAARVAGDPKPQWELLEPRGRARVTPAEYAPGGGAVKYLAYQVEDATVDGYFAVVKVRLLVQTLLPTAMQPRNVPPRGALLSDRWVRIGGTWYRSLEQESTEPGQP